MCKATGAARQRAACALGLRELTHFCACCPSVCCRCTLAAVVLCVVGLVDSLEREEEEAELHFFEAEREAVEREFEQRLEELRATLTNVGCTGMQA